MKKWIYFPILGLVAGELLIFDGKVLPGLGVHIINLLFITLLIVFSNLNLDIKNVLQGLILATLLRVVNLSMPQFFTMTLLQYPLIYGLMIIPIYNMIKSQQLSAKELGISFNKLYIYLPMSILIGFVTVIAEYRIINPAAIIGNIRFSNMTLIIIITAIFIGIVEEIIFRPILQTRLKKAFGLRYGILFSGLIFGVMHSTYGVLNEILFATIFGIILGFFFQKTNSLPFVSSIHGVTNIMLFGIFPFKMSTISNSIYSPGTISIGGEFMFIFMIVIFVLSILSSCTKYWNRYSSNTFNMFNSLFLVSMVIVVYKVMNVIYYG